MYSPCIIRNPQVVVYDICEEQKLEELSFVGGRGISNSMILTSARVVGGIGNKGGAEALLFHSNKNSRQTSIMEVDVQRKDEIFQCFNKLHKSFLLVFSDGV